MEHSCQIRWGSCDIPNGDLIRLLIPASAARAALAQPVEAANWRSTGASRMQSPRSRMILGRVEFSQPKIGARRLPGAIKLAENNPEAKPGWLR